MSWSPLQLNRLGKVINSFLHVRGPDLSLAAGNLSLIARHGQNRKTTTVLDLMLKFGRSNFHYILLMSECKDAR